MRGSTDPPVREDEEPQAEEQKTEDAPDGASNGQVLDDEHLADDESPPEEEPEPDPDPDEEETLDHAEDEDAEMEDAPEASDEGEDGEGDEEEPEEVPLDEPVDAADADLQEDADEEEYDDDEEYDEGDPMDSRWFRLSRLGRHLFFRSARGVRRGRWRYFRNRQRRKRLKLIRGYFAIREAALEEQMYADQAIQQRNYEEARFHRKRAMALWMEGDELRADVEPGDPFPTRPPQDDEK